jgi:2-phospho-L-lactate transferase/gluconeogenesis factor (CofD/UPF0052 family)
MINLVCFNGGRGASSLITAILKNPAIKLTSVVNAYDDGKSTGAIRKYFDMLGPSDIRKVQQLMLPEQNTDFKSNFWLFDYRFPVNIQNKVALDKLYVEVRSNKKTLFSHSFNDKALLSEIRSYLKLFLANLQAIKKSKNFKDFSFKDCSLMNCIYAGAFLAHNRNLEHATLAIEKLFNLTASVLPSSLENKKLMGIRENGTFLYSEAEIVELRSNVSVEKVFLLDDYLERKYFNSLPKKEKLMFLDSHHSYVKATSRVMRAINDADIIVFAPGTQHSSLYPTYLSRGIAQGVADNHLAKKFFISNIGADYETPQYYADDYILGAFKYLKRSDSRPYKIEELFTDFFINQPKSKDRLRYVQLRKKQLACIPVKQKIDNYESHSYPGKHSGEKLLEDIMNEYCL